MFSTANARHDVDFSLQPHAADRRPTSGQPNKLSLGTACLIKWSLFYQSKCFFSTQEESEQTSKITMDQNQANAQAGGAAGQKDDYVDKGLYPVRRHE